VFPTFATHAPRLPFRCRCAARTRSATPTPTQATWSPSSDARKRRRSHAAAHAGMKRSPEPRCCAPAHHARPRGRAREIPLTAPARPLFFRQPRAWNCGSAARPSFVRSRVLSSCPRTAGKLKVKPCRLRPLQQQGRQHSVRLRRRPRRHHHLPN